MLSDNHRRKMAKRHFAIQEILSQAPQKVPNTTADSKMDGIAVVDHVQHGKLAGHNMQVVYMIRPSVNGN